MYIHTSDTGNLQEVKSMNKNTNAKTWVTTVMAIFAVFAVSKNERTNVMLDITPHADGSFDRHYGRDVEATPKTLLAWMKSVAKMLAKGDFSSIEGIDHEYCTKELKHCTVDKVPTSEKAVIAYLGSQNNGKGPIHLLRFVRVINQSMKYVSRDNQTRSQARAKNPVAKTKAVDAKAILTALLEQIHNQGCAISRPPSATLRGSRWPHHSMSH